MLSPVFLDGIDNAAENGVGVVEYATATGPLRTLSGEHHGETALAFAHRGDWLAFLREGVQPLGQFFAAAYRKGRAHGKMGAVATEITDQRIEVRRLFTERFLQLPCALN